MRRPLSKRWRWFSFAGAADGRGAFRLSARPIASERVPGPDGCPSARQFRERVFDSTPATSSSPRSSSCRDRCSSALLAIAIGGYLTLGEQPARARPARWLYRWPLFIPFIVAAQCMRTFLAKNGMMNNTLRLRSACSTRRSTVGFLDWRGIVITFVWKQTPFAALMVAGAMAALDRSTIEAARNLGASRFGS